MHTPLRVILLLGILTLSSCHVTKQEAESTMELHELQQRVDEELVLSTDLINISQLSQADSLMTALFQDVLQAGNSDQVVKVATELAFIKLNMGRYEEALNTLNEVEPERLDQSTVHNRNEYILRKASILNEMGQFLSAMEILDPMMQQWEYDGPANEIQLLMLSTYAATMQNLYQYEKAIDTYQQSLQIGRQIGTSERNIRRHPQQHWSIAA